MKTVLVNKEQDKIQIFDCGISEYRIILEKQHEIVEQLHSNNGIDTVLIVEHKPVITLGARQNKNKILAENEELEKKGIEVVSIRRGGGATVHNPGQLVFYPIINLQRIKLGINEYIRKLEDIGIELLADIGLEAVRSKGFPGLWIDNKKIASIGVRVSRFITYHGMAININNDLSIFDFIVPCGIDNVEMTSVLKETGKKQSMNYLKEKLTEILIKTFT